MFSGYSLIYKLKLYWIGLMTMTTEHKTPPPERMTIKLNDKDHELFMSFGLMNTLAIPINTVDELIQIDSEPDLRNFILHSCLDKRDSRGATVEVYDLEGLGYSQGEEILTWVRGHLQDFFITRLRNKVAIQKRVNQTITQP